MVAELLPPLQRAMMLQATDPSVMICTQTGLREGLTDDPEMTMICKQSAEEHRCMRIHLNQCKCGEIWGGIDSAQSVGQSEITLISSLWYITLPPYTQGTSGSGCDKDRTVIHKQNGSDTQTPSAA
jgi:hypothetical protein